MPHVLFTTEWKSIILRLKVLSENMLILVLWIQKLSADFYNLNVIVPIRQEFNVLCDSCGKLCESKGAASQTFFIFTHFMWCQM